MRFVFKLKKIRQTLSPEQRFMALAMFLAVCVAVFGTLIWLKMPETVLTSIERPAPGRSDASVETEIEKEDGTRENYTLQIDARSYTKTRTGSLLQTAARILPRQILGNNKALSNVTEDVTLPTSAESGAITISWISSRPEILDYQGHIGDDPPSEGTEVTLTATLTLQEETLEKEILLTVFPKASDQFDAALKETLKTLNEDTTGELYYLPESVGGQTLTWLKKRSNPAPAAAVILLACAGALVSHRKNREKERAGQHRQQLEEAYPVFVSRFSLYFGAGLSIRQVFEALIRDEQGRGSDALKAELEKITEQMAHGVSEKEACAALGRTCGGAYRDLSMLLVQNLQKGNRQILPMLRAESERAFRERQRRSLADGSKNSTRLLLPMLLLFADTLILIIFPAMMSFYAR